MIASINCRTPASVYGREILLADRTFLTRPGETVASPSGRDIIKTLTLATPGWLAMRKGSASRALRLLKVLPNV